MNKLSIFSLKILRKLYGKTFRLQSSSKPTSEQDPNVVSQIIYDELMKEKPSMIARFGAFELSVVVNYLGTKNNKFNVWKYIRGETLPIWWNKRLLSRLENNAGFFPLEKEMVERFCILMLSDMKYIDILGSWMTEENYIINQISNAVLVQREIQNPFFTNSPWTKALKGKKVLVVHPFDELIRNQFANNRERIFSNSEVLPEFELKTLKAVQSIGGEPNGFGNWFAALEWMKSEMDKVEYDIALIGCGAYGLPLAAHAKRTGKKAVHLGGSLQLLFGIKGKRWENPDYNAIYNYSNLMNEYWVKPGESLKPRNVNTVEGGCYW